MQEKGARIYIYIAENGYFSRGSAVIGKWRSAQFPNHRGLEEGVEGERGINWSIIKPWLLPWKIGGHGGQIRDRPSFLSLSLPRPIIEPCNAVSSTRIDRVFTRHAAAANISAGRSEYFAGLLLSLFLSRAQYVSPLECEPLARSYAFRSVWHFLSRLATRSRQPTAAERRWRGRAPRSPVCLCKLPKCLVIKANLRKRRGREGREVFCQGLRRRDVAQSFAPVGILRNVAPFLFYTPANPFGRGGAPLGN